MKLMFMAACLLLSACAPYDDTDNMQTGERSGFSVYTDYLTGCQYLIVGISNGVTPRLDREGKPICKGYQP